MINRTLYLLIFCVLSVSCGGDASNSSANDPAITRPDATSQLIKKLSPIYQGVWIKADYLAKIRQSKSVLAAVDKVHGITAMEINTQKLLGDSLLVRVGWDNHNPGAVMLKFQPGKSAQSLKFGEDELSYRISNNDTTLTLLQVFEGKHFQTDYYKAMDYQPENNLVYGMNFEINKALVAGKYILAGDTKKTTVTFTEAGKVYGIRGLKSYYIENDLGGEPRNNLDRIVFNMYSDRQRSYAFVIKGVNLKLYETKVSADNKSLVLDKLKYQLVRITGQ